MADRQRQLEAEVQRLRHENSRLEDQHRQDTLAIEVLERETGKLRSEVQELRNQLAALPQQAEKPA